MPENWLEADIKQGISNSEVETRRKRYGFNEISSEKESLFIKFLMFFTGPVLYGKSTTRSNSHDGYCTRLHHAMAAFAFRIAVLQLELRAHEARTTPS